MSEEVIAQIKKDLLELDKEGAVEKAKRIVAAQGEISVKEAVDALSEGLQVVGEKFQSGEWYLAELIYAGEKVLIHCHEGRSRSAFIATKYIAEYVLLTVDYQKAYNKLCEIRPLCTGMVPAFKNILGVT